jgi:hypothetical protein
MKTIIVSESQLSKLVKKLQKNKLNEGNDMGVENYMFFGNLEQMNRQTQMLMELDPTMVDQILKDGHDWAADHIAEAKNNMDQVFDFMMNTINEPNMVQESDEDDFTVEPNIKKIPREYEISTVFGKYGEQVPNDVLRYMRKNPQGVIENLLAIYGDKLLDRVEKAIDKRNMK